MSWARSQGLRNNKVARGEGQAAAMVAQSSLRTDVHNVAASRTYEEARRLSGRIVLEGRLTTALAEATFPVENPADESEIGFAPRCTQADVERAVTVAHRAFRSWSRLSARQRGDLLRKVADTLEARRDELARLLCLETGNALSTQARPEIDSMLEILRLFAGVATELKGRTIPWDAGQLCYTTRDPLGVVGAIIPWNAPLFLTACKIGPSLAAGNTIVLKAAEQAPLAVVRCLEIMQEVLPPGVANVITGFGEEAGRPLVEHPLVRKVTFTGSCAVGKLIMRYAADKLCPVTLELGGKSPNIVLPDADLDLVIPGLVTGMRFTRQGQSCSAGTRILVHEKVYDMVAERAVKAVSRLRIGDPMDEATEMGAIISREQYERILSYLDMARKTPGARILCGGGRPTAPVLSKGYFLAPTLIEGIPQSSPVCQDEIFGPIAILQKWHDFEEMLVQANSTEFGLAAAIWTRDLSRALAFVDRIEAGFVQVNQYITPRATLSYGGLKMSGLGKENTLESMLEHFTSSKTVVINPGTPGV
jgi:acyl-CoA reductase-like NAD-dependent aldehyde dehydrogenase